MPEPHGGYNTTADPSWQGYVPPICADMPLILIVDSYLDEAEMYTLYLRSRGADADHVARPEAAFSRMRGSPPAVVVADMVFKWSGYDAPRFVRALRERPECALTRFIVLSGYTRPVDRERVRVAGADCFLLKPCAPDKLLRHISALVKIDGRTGAEPVSRGEG